MKTTFRIAKTSLLVIASWLVAGCNTTGPMEIPQLAAIQAQAQNDSLFQNSLFRQDSSGTIRLEKVVVALDRGHVIAHFPAGGGAFAELGDYCNHQISTAGSKVEWGGGAAMLGNWSTEFGKIFFDVMQKRGYRVVGDPANLFGKIEEIQAAEYLVGARITDIRGNFCQKHHWWDGRPLPQFKGESYVKVDWEVFSSFKRRVIYRHQTEGYAKSGDFKREGVMIAVHNAFADAVERVSVDDRLRQIVNKTLKEPKTAVPAERMYLVGIQPSRRPVRENLKAIINAVVTIQLGTGHGSGFVISNDGFLLTNAHVVGDGKRVPVLFDNGLRVNGEVIRISKERDVALVRVPVQSSYVLPIARNKQLERFDEVYVIGSPGDVKLRSTITKGIVSAFRTERNGNTFIQSDAAITSGNSGGPMVDAMGNVVGITVAGYAGQNLNLFIPIDDALKALNVEIEVE